MVDYWVKLPVDILDDRNLVELPDNEWRALIESVIRDRKNWHCDPNPLRQSWMAVRKEMTRLVLERDPHMCTYCGAIDRLEIDHIIPLARGGTNDLDNLQILCKKCNQRKWAKL